MGVSSAFRDSEVGPIPSDWECVRLTDVARLESGHTPSRRIPAYWNGDIPWISLADTDGLDEREIYDTEQTIGPLGLANSSARLLPKGTVVFSRTATIGKVSVMKREMATSQDFANYVCGDRVHNHFLAHLFRSWGQKWKQMMAGSTHNTIYMPVFEKLKVPLPAVPEQNAIAEALSDVDALIASHEQLIAKKRLMKQGAMHELLTGKRRLPGFEKKPGLKPSELGPIPRDWGVVAAASLGRFRGGAGFPPTHQGHQSGRYPFFKVSDMNNPGNERVMSAANNYISEITRHRLGVYAFPQNTIAFAKVGAAIFLERKKLLGQPSCMDNNMAGYEITAADAEVTFVHQVLLNMKLGDLVATTALPSLNGTTLGAIPLQLPPTLDEQRTIAAILRDMETELEALDTKLAKARMIRQGMMHNLLTGKIRLT